MPNRIKLLLGENNKLNSINLLAILSAASVLRKEKILKQVLEFAKIKKLNCQKIYEAILQTYLFAGFPIALISLSIFHEYFPNCGKFEIKDERKDLYKIGVDTCRKIYGNKFEKLITNTKNFSPELADWLIIEGYGKVLSRDILSLKERELLNISILTSLKFENQLYSHINGAYRLGIKFSTMKKVIRNLDLLGSSTYSKFGIKVLNKYMERKRVK